MIRRDAAGSGSGRGGRGFLSALRLTFKRETHLKDLCRGTFLCIPRGWYLNTFSFECQSLQSLAIRVRGRDDRRKTLTLNFWQRLAVPRRSGNSWDPLYYLLYSKQATVVVFLSMPAFYPQLQCCRSLAFLKLRGKTPPRHISPTSSRSKHNRQSHHSMLQPEMHSARETSLTSSDKRLNFSNSSAKNNLPYSSELLEHFLVPGACHGSGLPALHISEGQVTSGRLWLRW